MIVVPFQEWHFHELELEGPEKRIAENYGSHLPAVLSALKYHGATFSWYEDKKILGICGMAPLWTGVGEAYMFLSPEFKKRKIRCIKDIKKYLELMTKQFKFHRINAYVIKDFEKALRFAEFLGFEKEAELKQYGPNKEDYYLMRRMT
jgi:RimJ/RimL family protein N-acetyltransferase